MQCDQKSKSECHHKNSIQKELHLECEREQAFSSLKNVINLEEIFFIGVMINHIAFQKVAWFFGSKRLRDFFWPESLRDYLLAQEVA